MSSTGRPQVGQLFDSTKDQLTESMLISAYDLHHGYLRAPRTAITDVTFVDSGGYEVSDFQDLSAFFYPDVIEPRPAGKKRPKPKRRRQSWSEAQLKRVYLKWPDHVPAVFVSFDRRGTVAAQARAAARLLTVFGSQLHAFLIKPRTKSAPFVSIDDILASCRHLRPFHFLGLTEKELGPSILDRMVRLTQLRLGLDERGLRDKPIHVFGALDPITVPLYFVAGAEVFDGLTWLRYGFDDGAALYRQNSAIRRHGVQHTDDHVKLMTARENLIQLSELSMQLRRFLNDHDFRQLAPNEGHLRRAYESLVSRSPRLRTAEAT